MSASADAWRENFRVHIECTRCGGHFQCDRPVVGTERYEGKHQRCIVVYAPETCPDCHSLHIISTAPAAAKAKPSGLDATEDSPVPA